MNEKRRITDRFTHRLLEWLVIIATTLGIATSIWATVLQPKVRDMARTEVDSKLDPVYAALRFNECMHRAQMTSDQWNKAEQLYKEGLRLSGQDR
jgi:hypothetical protein